MNDAGTATGKVLSREEMLPGHGPGQPRAERALGGGRLCGR
jgi:hypothetical protein